MTKLNLTPQQQAVVENSGGSLLVSAAAGSGKTKVLVERLFRYVTEDCSERHNIDDFLIITYTKAAAAELRSKIAQELSRRIGEAPENKSLQLQLFRVYKADIKTVDAFCTALLRENTHLLARSGERYSLTSDFRVLDDDEATLLRQRVLERVLDEFYHDMSEGDVQLADTLGAGRDDSSIVKLVLELYEKIQSHAYPEKWLEKNRKAWNDLTGNFDETVYAKELLLMIQRKAVHWRASLQQAAERITCDTALFTGYGEKFLIAAESFRALEDSKDWNSAKQAVDWIEFPRLNTPKGRKDAPEVIALKRIWDACKTDIKKIESFLSVDGEEAMADLRVMAPAMTALLNLTTNFETAYRNAKLRMNVADFSDQEHLALQLLVQDDGIPTELGEQVAARYHEILVDEYQDTNEVQNAIFRAVSKDGKNIFMVGDVKQSIYRFRQADPTIFLGKYNRFRHYEEAECGEERKILLSRNFRSRKEILDATNFVFENILSEEMGEMEYGEDEKLHFGADYYPERNDCETEFHLITVEQKNAENRQSVKKTTAEARFVAKRIHQLLNEGYMVTDEDGSLRTCRPEDIVILMRSPGNRMADYANALLERNIPCSFDENSDFFHTMEISVMMALLELVDNPRQDVPMISVLRSPIFGFTPDRLAELRGKTPNGDFYDAVEADDGEDSKAFLEELKKFRTEACRKSVYQLIWSIYNDLNVLGIFGAMDSGAERRENLIAFSRQAEKFESNGYKGLFAFVRQLRQQLDSDHAPITKGASVINGVRMMSIHKSKGLEFPIVILSDLDHAFSRQDFDSTVLVHPEMGLGPIRIDLKRKIKYPTLARRAIEEKLRRENLAEEQRILYVAMTRAKEKLILVDSMYFAEGHLQKLAAMASCPVQPETVASAKNFGDWLLLPLLCRPEAASLRKYSGMDTEVLCEERVSPWQIFIHDGEAFRYAPRMIGADAEEEIRLLPFESALWESEYRYSEEATLRAKVTATQLKGRTLDEEISEGTERILQIRVLSHPKFHQRNKGLSPAERGTATHLVLQHLVFSDLDIEKQIAGMETERKLTKEQAEAIDVASLRKLLESPLGRQIAENKTVEREYRFTVFLNAKEISPKAQGEDSVLLQGVVDCFFETDEGLTVVDFKTDRVWTEEEIRQRAELYRTQLNTYTYALERVLQKKVAHRILYFLPAGMEVEVENDRIDLSNGKEEKISS